MLWDEKVALVLTFTDHYWHFYSYKQLNNKSSRREKIREVLKTGVDNLKCQAEILVYFNLECLP